MARARAFHSRRHTRKEHSAWKYKVGRHAAGCMLLTAAAAAPAQLCQGGRLQGVVRDPAGAVLSDATVQPQGGKAVRTDAHGQFAIDCVHGGNPELTISAEGFETEHVRYKAADRELVVVLPVARVYTTVDAVDGDARPEAGGSGLTLSGADVQRMADDPDDFKKQLQVLAAVAGGAPGQATITVDGFQNAGTLPPKSVIASVRVAPDMFSAEYASPPYAGGRVEILTKPGLGAIHGALFFTNSNGALNATNPFSLSSTPASKQRYGFELSAPLIRNRLDTSIALEHRDITDFAVVNAVTLDANDVRQNFRETVRTPQHLWTGSVRGDLQATKTDTVTVSWTANIDADDNQGVGGLVLPEAGYNSQNSEYDLRVSNSQIVGASVLHQARFGLSWKSSEQLPLSAATGISVAGFFQSGGSTAQHRRNADRDVEIADSVLVSHGRHSVSVGVQVFGYLVNNTVPNYFNGSYLFGGGSAPSLSGSPQASTTIDALEQFRRASHDLPGGTPTLYQTTQGTAEVNFTQWQAAGFAQDTLRLPHRFSLSGGMRYALQTSPESVGNLSPRVGLSWAPDRKSHWVLHARAGLFSAPIGIAVAGEAYRLNGSRQTGVLTYSPGFGQGLLATSASAVTVTTVRQFSANAGQTHSVETQIGVEHDLPKHWNVQASLFHADAWNDLRTININAPIVGTSSGTAPDLITALRAPRPNQANSNVLQYSNDAHLRGDIFFAGVNQHGYKRFGVFLGYLHMNLKTDGGLASVQPQSTYSKAGEQARPDWQAAHRIFLVGNVLLPLRLELSTETDASSGTPYNLTTGTDNNGDGSFNDRPSFASVAGTGVYSTHFGLLTTNVVNGSVPRNFGTLPWVAHVDMNLARTISLGDRTSRPLSITVNARAANLLNHTNVTAVGTVVSSPNLGQPILAEQARRCEAGVRFNF